jgi:hypothetical protein
MLRAPPNDEERDEDREVGGVTIPKCRSKWKHLKITKACGIGFAVRHQYFEAMILEETCIVAVAQPVLIVLLAEIGNTP